MASFTRATLLSVCTTSQALGFAAHVDLDSINRTHVRVERALGDGSKDPCRSTRPIFAWHMHMVYVVEDGWEPPAEAKDFHDMLDSQFGVNDHVCGEAFGMDDAEAAVALYPNTPTNAKSRPCTFHPTDGFAGPWRPPTYTWAIGFGLDYFDEIVRFAVQKRPANLTVFVHPTTGCQEEDHGLSPIVMGNLQKQPSLSEPVADTTRPAICLEAERCLPAACPKCNYQKGPGFPRGGPPGPGPKWECAKDGAFDDLPACFESDLAMKRGVIPPC